MAAKLECEICGGKLIGKPGGIFECDSCGMEYSTEWAKAKIQEIKGTVKVEGTVEVTGKVQVEGGTVQVEGAVTKESLLKRAEMCCAEKDWGKAKALIEQVLNIDPECGEAYLTSVMVERVMQSKEDLHAYCTNAILPLPQGKNMERAQQFLPELFAQWKEEKERNYAAYLKKYEESGAAQLRARYAKTDGLLVCGYPGLLGIRTDGTVLVSATETREPDAAAIRQWDEITTIACGVNHTVGLRADGTVVAVGKNGSGQCNVEKWRNITAIACGGNHTVGLRADGTVVAVGANENGQCNVRDWRDVTAIACGDSHTAGLRADGTVVAAGCNEEQCNAIKGWRDITAIACSGSHTVGLRADGTAAATDYPNCENWRDVVSLVCNGEYGLRKNGTLAPSWGNLCCGWSDIIAVSGYGSHISALRSDGTVICAGGGESQKWTDIVSICSILDKVYGIRKDGTVVAAGESHRDVSGWRLFNSIDTLEQERTKGLARARAEHLAKEKAKADRIAQKKAELQAERDELQAELSQLKGLFSGKRRKEIELLLTVNRYELQELEEQA